MLSLNGSGALLAPHCAITSYCQPLPNCQLCYISLGYDLSAQIIFKKYKPYILVTVSLQFLYGDTVV